MKKKIAPKVIEYNPIVPPERAHGYKNARWVENVSRGLRLVGFADEIASAEGRRRTIDHKGWHTDDDGGNGEYYRGVVYLLPSRGEPLYVYGYADPNNDDCALLCFDTEADKMDAARYADQFAERFAEDQRDHNRAWQAGRRCEDLADEVQAMRKKALAIGAEMRDAKRAKLDAPTICATLRDKIMSLYRQMQKARKEIAELTDNYGTRDGFAE
jgi:hypothetical protein